MAFRILLVYLLLGLFNGVSASQDEGDAEKCLTPFRTAIGDYTKHRDEGHMRTLCSAMSVAKSCFQRLNCAGSLRNDFEDTRDQYRELCEAVGTFSGADKGRPTGLWLLVPLAVLVRNARV